MFGLSKDELRDQLVESWNALKQAIPEPVRFFRIDKGWDFYVCAEVVTNDDKTEIHVLLFNSLGAAQFFKEHGYFPVRKKLRMSNPIRRIDAENLGLRNLAQWTEDLGPAM